MEFKNTYLKYKDQCPPKFSPQETEMLENRERRVLKKVRDLISYRKLDIMASETASEKHGKSSLILTLI